MRSEYHHLYNTAAWRQARAAQLAAEPLCRMCKQLGRIFPAGVVDHIKPHRGDRELFLSRTNLQSLCKHCHDAHKQAQEHNADGVLRGAGLDGTPIDLAHPWHRPVAALAPASVEGRGVGKSEALALQTGRYSPFATCHNSMGGPSA